MSMHTAKPMPLTADHVVLNLVDHRAGLTTGIRDCSIGELKHRVVGLAMTAHRPARAMRIVASAC